MKNRIASLLRAVSYLVSILLLIYVLFSVYFMHHFYFNTILNGIDLSLKAHEETDQIVKNHVNSYTLRLIEQNGEIEEIRGQDIQLRYNEYSSIAKVLQKQNPLLWIRSLWGDQTYPMDDLIMFNERSLEREISKLHCLNRDSIESQNVSFQYANGSYQVREEVQGNRVIKDELYKAIKVNLRSGKQQLNLLEAQCYETPRYRLDSDKTIETVTQLNRYVSTSIKLTFGNEYEILNGDIIHEWLTIDENLEVVIDLTAVRNYVAELSKKYDTVGIARNFKTSTGKVIEVKDGLYGWKMDRAAETKALLHSIMLGETIEKEPIYLQKALSRGENEIGNTYVEVSITKQYLWFYQNGELIAQGPIVTGNPNRGNATVTGTYMLNYKQKGAILRGANYTSKVNYWMPFFGNMGIHDAAWRYSFGGQIYKRNGTHGCINAPLFLAKAIFERIEEGIPIIIYEE